MQPFFFWILGALSLVAGLAAIVQPRPVRCAGALVVVMAVDCGILFLLGAPLLGFEVLLTLIGGVLLIALAVGRREILRLGTAGLARITWLRIGVVVVVVALCVVLWPLLADSSPPAIAPEPEARGGFGAWLALLLVGSATCTAWLVIRAGRPGRQSPPESPERQSLAERPEPPKLGEGA